MRTVARLVDGSLGLRGLSVTAIERVHDNRSDSVPVRAMFEEVNERLAGARPAEVVPVRVRHWFVVLPLACGLLVLAAIAPIERRDSPVASVDFEAISPESVTMNLERLADLLDGHELAEETELAAYGPALRELSEYVSTSGTVDLVAAERLSQLLDSLARTAAASDTAAAAAVATAFEGTMFDSSASDPSDRPFRFGSDEVADTGSSEPAVDEEPSTTMSSEFDPASVFRTLGEVASSVERSVGDVAASTSGDRTDAGSPDGEVRSGGYYTDWNEEMADAQAAKRAAIRQRGRGEAVAGEATQADDSPGDAAGRGSQPLDSGRAEQDAGLLELQAQDFLVDAELRAGGNTNSYLPEPEAGVRSVGGMGSRLRESLVAGVEIPVAIESVATGNRDLVAAYFGRLNSGSVQTRAP